MFKPLAGELDESYNLTVTIDGVAKISAFSPSGVIYALETFTQLFYQHSSGASAGLYTKMAPIEIHDHPKFSHRGLNMDLSRNWEVMFPYSILILS
jgi:hexosaminidase